MALPMHKLHLGDGESTRLDNPSLHSTPIMVRTTSSPEPRSARMKLFVDAGTGRVVFAEAGKDVVDFLFSLLAMPLGRADKVLAALGGMGGSVGNLYASVEQLDTAHVQPGAAARETLLQPNVLSPPAASAELSFHQQRKLYTCSNSIYRITCSSRNVTDGRGTMCPSCGKPMTKEARYVPPGPAAAGDVVFGQGGDAAGYMVTDDLGVMPTPTTARDVGFVRGGDAARYVVTDDLRVMPAPMTAGELLALFTALGVGNVSALQESHVQLGFTEGKEILKASLQSTAVLTDVFLRRRAAGSQHIS